MAVLTETQRLEIWRGLMRYWHSQGVSPGALIKQDIKDAVDNTDVWIDGHEGNTGDTTGYNGALPTTYKNNATASQKTELFIFVAARRGSKELLQLLFGEVD